MDALRLIVEFTLEDWLAYQSAGRRRQSVDRAGRWWVTYIPIALAVVCSFVLAPQAIADTSLWRIFAIVTVWVSAMFVIRRLYISVYQPSKHSVFLGSCTLEFDALGVHTARPGITATYDWSRIQNIGREGDTLYLWLDSTGGVVVPLRSLPDSLTADGAENLIRSLYADGRLRTAIADASAPSTPTVAPKPTLLQRLNDVCRLWLLKPSKDISSMATEPSIVALALLSLGLWIGLDWLQAGPNSRVGAYPSSAATYCWRSVPLSSHPAPPRRRFRFELRCTSLAQ